MKLPKDRIITEAQRIAMPSPPAGVVFYVSDRETYAIYDGTRWHELEYSLMWESLLRETFDSGSIPSHMTTVDDTNNKWVVGNADSYSGDYSLYISNDGGSSANYSNDEVSHVYFDVSLPSNIQKWRLRGVWRSVAEPSYDYARVYIAPTSYVPTAGSLPSGSGVYQIGENEYNDNNSWREDIIEQDDTEAGNTIRIIISFRSDISGIYPPSIMIDNLNVEILR